MDDVTHEYILSSKTENNICPASRRTGSGALFGLLFCGFPGFLFASQWRVAAKKRFLHQTHKPEKGAAFPKCGFLGKYLTLFRVWD